MDHIIIFDGLCNLCSRSVHIIIRRDKAEVFHFVPFQSEYAVNLLRKHEIDLNDLKTLILIKGGQVYLKSDAALEIAREFHCMWKLLLIFKVVPRSLRNKCYDKIAENRYNWFGKKEKCMIPDPDIKSRFLE